MHVQDITGIETLAHLVSRLSKSHPGRIFSFPNLSPYGPRAGKQKLSSDLHTSLGRIALQTVASALGAQAGNLRVHKAGILAQGGATVSNVSLQLHQNGVLFLGGSSGTVLNDVEIEGKAHACSQCRRASRSPLPA